MHERKALRARGRRPALVVLSLAMLAVAGTIATTTQGASPVVGKGGGFGEVYQAKASTLAKTLFAANLLPANPTGRNIALAAFGRSEKKVNPDLALKCWKNNGCTTGTKGKLTVAYVEGFG